MLKARQNAREGPPFRILVTALDGRRDIEPFFTTKAAGTGTGLGLPVVKQLVESWGGQILAQSQPGEGSRMVLDIPSASSPCSPGAPP